MDFLKKINHKVWFLLYVNICIGAFISLSSYVHVPLHSVKEYGIYIVHFILLQLTVFGFTYFLTLHKWLFKIGFSFLFVLMSFVAFWIYTMDITISVDLIQISLESKPDIFVDLISIPLIIYIVFNLGVLYSILFFYSKIDWTFKKRIKGVIFSCLAILLFFIFEQKKYGVFKRRMPYVAALEIVNYFNKKPLEFNTSFNKDIKANNKVNIVFVLGESVRAKNMQLNGYHRLTNPMLSKREGVYSLQQIFTSNTYTAKSVPQILTNKSIKDTVNNNVYSLYSVLNKAEYHTTWVGNQTPEVSFRDLIFHNKEVNLIDVEHSVLSYHKKYDEELLTIFKNIYNTDNSNIYTLHMIGSHWWYESRYSKKFKKFTPVVKTKYLPASTSEEMINSYDNTIVYLDYFLDNIISFLEKKEEETILIYLSDHGEILGEDGKWLHGQNHPASKNPAGLIWCSQSFQEKYPDKIENLKNNIAKKITTDFLFHSVLDIIDIQSFKYDSNQSIFSNNP